MHLCYVDESGTPDVPGTTSHFVLAGLALPIWEWRNADIQVNAVCERYGLAGREIHTAWLLRSYIEQSNIAGFADMSWDDRRYHVNRERAAAIFSTRQRKNAKSIAQTKKNYKQTEDYIHLTREERASFVVDIAYLIASWDFATIFAECIDKLHFMSAVRPGSIDEQAFEQVISRFERYLQRTSDNEQSRGLVVHDNNQTVAKKHTNLMRRFHARGTLWTSINRIIETPMFVDSKLTSMVQMADLCSYAIRRYLENSERQLIDIIYPRFDSVPSDFPAYPTRKVGIRHFADRRCDCVICKTH